MQTINSDIPESYPRRVLLMVAGTTPQILTETLWALVNREQPFIPTEIHVMTTTDGAKRIELQLLKPGAHFEQFCIEYSITGKISFPLENVRVIQNQQGDLLRDIVTPEDNEAAANQIIEWIRQFANDDNNAIHACLAAGRKTMGFYLGYGMSLLGRKQDRLSHVLVTQDFENNKDFFYIPRKEKVLVINDSTSPNGGGRPVTTVDAKIWLAEIPFVRLSEGMPDSLRKGESSYTRTVEIAQSVLANNEIQINIGIRQLICGGYEIHLPPKELAFYLWFARRKLQLGQQSWLSYMSKGIEQEFQEYLRAYEDILGEGTGNPNYDEAVKSLSLDKYKVDNIKNNFWASPIHKIKIEIIKQLGETKAEVFLINKKKINRLNMNSLTIDPSLIRIN